MTRPPDEPEVAPGNPLNEPPAASQVADLRLEAQRELGDLAGNWSAR